MKPSSLLAMFAVAGLLAAQCPSGSTQLITNLAANNGQSGVMFDVVATNTLTICTFNVNFLPGTWNISIYTLPSIPDTGASYYQPNHNLAAPWGTPIANVSVVSNGTNIATPLPLALNQVVNAGERKAFYITATVGTGQRYVNGTAHNSLWAADSNLTIFTGCGKALPLFSAGIFGGTATASRNFSGSICYVPGTSGCPTGQWEQNDGASSLDFNGAQSNGWTGPGLSTPCVGSMVSTNLASTNVGLGFDVAISFMPAVAANAGGFSTPNGQKVNVDFTDPTMFFLNGMAFPPFPGAFAIPFGAPPFGITAQMVNFDPTNPDMIALSQAAQLAAITPAAVIAGPVGDDAAISLTAGTPSLPACLTPQPIALYGTTYTQYHVITNGRVVFGPAANTSFTPLATYAATEARFAGAHADLNTTVGGNITILPVNNGINNGLQVNYNNVGYFGGLAGSSGVTMTLEIWDNSNVNFNNVAFATPTAARNMFVGVHPGGAALIEAGFPLNYVGSGSFNGVTAGASHGVFGDHFVTPLADNPDSLQFAWNGTAYDVLY